MKHTINPALLRGQVNVALVGCGGVGSQVLTGLARLHKALVALGHPGGLHVTAFDPDTVSDSNVGRQLFSPADVGVNKATLLIHRLNAFFGLSWAARPELFTSNTERFEIIISCVDTKAARREIKKQTYQKGCRYWIDTGNDVTSGQVVLGQPEYHHDQRKKKDRKYDLPVITDLFPEIMDTSIAEDNTPSCSLAESLESQDLFIGQSVGTFALQLLWSLFRNGGLDHQGYFINLTAGMVLPMKINPEWRKTQKPRSRNTKKHQIGRAHV